MERGGILGTGKKTETVSELERGGKTHFGLSRQLITLYFPLPVEWASEGGNE